MIKVRPEPEYKFKKKISGSGRNTKREAQTGVTDGDPARFIFLASDKKISQLCLESLLHNIVRLRI